MSYEDHLYHSQREQQCRDLADRASDPDVRRRHHELAELHAGRAAAFPSYAQANSNFAEGRRASA